MMRILHVTGVYRPRVGGIEIFVEDLVDRQRRAGHEVDVLTSTPGPGAVSRKHAAPGIIRVRDTVLVPPSLTEAYRAVDEGRYDVVHAHLSVVSPFSSLIARYAAKRGIPVVNTVHSMWHGREGWVRLVQTLTGWKRTPMHWTAVSRVAASDMRAVLGYQVPIDVVPNAVDVAWWRPTGPGRPQREITLVSVMRMAARKRPLELLETLEEVRRQVSADIRLKAVLVGDGPLMKRLRHDVADRGMGDWVTLSGRVTREDIRELYRTAEVYIAPAYQESFGIAALEARAAGLAVVAMMSGGVGEFVEQGVEGVLCHNDAEMVDALRDLATDDALRSRIVGYNRRVPPKQDWPNTLFEFGQTYLSAGAVGMVHPEPEQLPHLDHDQHRAAEASRRR